MALKDKAARAAYNKAYRERRAATLSDEEKNRLRERHNAKQRHYCARGYQKQALREPRTLAARRAALRWDRLRSASRDARRWEAIEDAREAQLRLLSEVWFGRAALSP